MSQSHESFDRDHHAGGGSDRSFGLVMAAAFAVFTVWPLLHRRPVRLWCAAVSVLFLVAALATPSLLKPLNRAWTRLGVLIGRVTNPIITGLLFLLVFVPAAAFLRLLGKDLLSLRLQPEAPSYWVHRQPSAYSATDLRNQF